MERTNYRSSSFLAHVEPFKNFDLVLQIYLDEDNLEWGKATGEAENDENKLVHRYSNDVILNT